MNSSEFVFLTNPFSPGGGLSIFAVGWGTCAKRLRRNNPENK